MCTLNLHNMSSILVRMGEKEIRKNASKLRGLPGSVSGKEPTVQFRRPKRCGFDPWIGKIPWRRATHSSILAWRIPWTEEAGRLPSMGSKRVGHNWSDLAQTQSKKEEVRKSRINETETRQKQRMLMKPKVGSLKRSMGEKKRRYRKPWHSSG